MLEDAARRLSREQPDLGNSISLALKKTVFRKHGKVSDPVEKQNAALRRKLLYYVIGISFALALALCWTAAS